MEERIQKLVSLIQDEIEISVELIIERIKKFDDGKSSDEDIVYFVIDSFSRT